MVILYYKYTQIIFQKNLQSIHLRSLKKMFALSNYHNSKVSYELYIIKRSRQPDHLINMIERVKQQKQNMQYNNLETYNDLDSKVKEAIRKNLIQKRVDNILNTSNQKFLISEPVKCSKRQWVSPIEMQMKQKKFSQEQLMIEDRKQQKRKYLSCKTSKENLNNILNILNINKKMKYFGSFLSSEFDQDNIQNINKVKQATFLNIPKNKQSKLDYLSNKFKNIKKKATPKLFVFNAPIQKEKLFNNPLIQDEYFSNIIKKDDKQLVKLLIKTLENQGNFSLTSFSDFYNIFVWQTAHKALIIKFVTKILMEDHEQLQISLIAKIIDFICQKIKLTDLLAHNTNSSRSSGIVDNFSEIMKKLLFGEDYEFAIKNEYFLTRKTLIESLERNQECISIFVNVFYM